jgi:hypothetical protein
MAMLLPLQTQRSAGTPTLNHNGRRTLPLMVCPTQSHKLCLKLTNRLVWHNIAYGITFGSSVSFYHSTGSDPLTLTAGPVSVSGSSNGADWHLGVLRLPRSGQADGGAEDWYYSGVYIESGTLTTSVTGPST